MLSANQRKNSEEKREQMKQKREEKDAERKAKALMKLRRVESITKPDLVSDKVKQYDLKRADVLDRQKSKDAMRKMRLERSMSREKPDTVSDVAKKYNERRAEVLERIQKKQENIKTNYEKKMNKPLPDKGKSRDGMENATLQSGNINAKVQDERGRYYTSEGSENVQSENTRRFLSSKRSNRRMTFDVLDGISDVDNILEVVEEEAPAVTNVLNCKSPSNNSDAESGYFTEQTTDRSSSGHHRSLSRYNSFDTKSVLPRIECK